MSPQDRRGYHHGNLRDALIDAALDLISERGLAGVTFAEIARAVGVSPAAPYRHFRDFGALIAELGRRSFDRLTERLEAAWDQGRPDPVTAIENCGRAYLTFVRQERAAYAVMFDAFWPASEAATRTAAAGRAFAVLKQAAEAAATTVPAAQRPPATMMALHIWAMAHGVADLFIGSNDSTRFRVPMPPEDLLEAGLLIYLQSLGLKRGG